MKALRALMLILVLSVCSYAGNIPTCLIDNIPPDAAGNMETDAADPITEIAINLLQSVLSLI